MLVKEIYYQRILNTFQHFSDRLEGVDIWIVIFVFKDLHLKVIHICSLSYRNFWKCATKFRLLGNL